MIGYMFSKACSETQGYSMKSFNTMIASVSNFKKGEAAAKAHHTSASASANNTYAVMDTIVPDLSNVGGRLAE
jgi:hypothetical protein